MNVVISNKYQTLLSGLEIEVIKEMHGEFSVDEIISAFQNFFYSRMILDITAIRNYQDIKNLQRLSISLDMSKVILLLDDTPESKSTDFLSKLISMGIYNFSKNLDDIRYQLETPNTYRDVAHIQQLENLTIDTGEVKHQNSTPTQPKDNVAVPTNETPVQSVPTSQPTVPRAIVIGFKNLTRQAGATTLIYLMKKQLEEKYRVTAMEIDKRDFMYFDDKELVSISSSEVPGALAKYYDSEVILIDINNSSVAEQAAKEIIYLLEPSIIQVNRLMVLNSKALAALRSKKVVLNKSFLSAKDVTDFSYEAKIKIFFNLPPINDRSANDTKITEFLLELGFDRLNSSSKKGGKKILGLFG